MVGGVDLLIDPLTFVLLSRNGALSPDGLCRTFDSRADGYVPGEGAVALVLKPLRADLADRDHHVEFVGAGVDGGAGFDRVILSSASDAYQVSLADTGVTLTSGGEAIVTSQVQYFDFGGTVDDVLIVVDQVGAQVAGFYDLLLGRVADYEGLAYWMDALDSGLDIAGIASSFAASSEFAAQGDELSASDFIALLYDQILGRGGDEAGVGYWVGQVDGGQATFGDIAAGFALSAEAAAIGFDHIVVTTVPDMQIA